MRRGALRTAACKQSVRSLPRAPHAPLAASRCLASRPPRACNRVGLWRSQVPGEGAQRRCAGGRAPLGAMPRGQEASDTAGAPPASLARLSVAPRGASCARRVASRREACACARAGEGLLPPRGAASDMHSDDIKATDGVSRMQVVRVLNRRLGIANRPRCPLHLRNQKYSPKQIIYQDAPGPRRRRAASRHSPRRQLPLHDMLRRLSSGMLHKSRH